MTFDDFRTLDPGTPLLDSLGLPDEVRTFITNLPAEQWAALRLTVGAVLYRAVEAELMQLRAENQRLRAQLQGPPRRSSDPFDKADLPDDQ